MRKSVERCLFAMSERERTVPVLIKRMGEIQATMRRASGVMKRMYTDRLARNPVYWAKLAEGWGEKIRLMANELSLIQAALAKELSQE